MYRVAVYNLENASGNRPRNDLQGLQFEISLFCLFKRVFLAIQFLYSNISYVFSIKTCKLNQTIICLE